MKITAITSISTILVLLLTSPAALASKARLRALGQSPNGSLFVKDGRDIFLNPAMVNEFGRSANFEWGATTVNPSASQAYAEGGMLFKTDRLNYALQLGRKGEATQSMIASTATGGVLSGTSLYIPQNSLDAIFGGSANAGFKWGGGIHYARSESNTGPTVEFPDKKARVLSFSGGINMGQITGYGRWDLIHESATDLAGGGKLEYSGKPGGELGGKFDFAPEAGVSLVLTRIAHGFDTSGGSKGDYTNQRLRTDYYRSLGMSEKLFSFVTAGIMWSQIDVSYSTVGVNAVKKTNLTSPLVLGLEARALSWLTLRAAVQQNILLDRETYQNGSGDYDKTNDPEDTAVAAGFSVAFDQFQLDGTFKGATSTTGDLDGNTLASNVSLLYNF